MERKYYGIDHSTYNSKDTDTDHDATAVPTRQAGTDQTGHKVGRRRAVVPADPGRNCGHNSMVEVQGAAVSRVWIQSTKSCLPDLKGHETKWTFLHSLR